jgi:protocatechuate 3,4-dioxygenase beta subunit
MARNRRRWLWLLLLLLFIFLLWHNSGQQKYKTAKSSTVSVDPGKMANRSDHPPNEIRNPQELPPGARRTPAYVRPGDVRLREYDQPIDFIFTGRVTSEQGEPLPGVMVSLHNSRPEFPNYQWLEAIISQTSDAEGHFSIAMRSPVRACVSIRKEGFTQKEDLVDFSDQATIVKSYRLFPAPACVEGYVLDHRGIPVAGAAILPFIFSGDPGGHLRCHFYFHTQFKARARTGCSYRAARNPQRLLFWRSPSPVSSSCLEKTDLFGFSPITRRYWPSARSKCPGMTDQVCRARIRIRVRLEDKEKVVNVVPENVISEGDSGDGTMPD